MENSFLLHFDVKTYDARRCLFGQSFNSLKQLRPEKNHLVLYTSEDYYCLPLDARQLLAVLPVEKNMAVQQLYTLAFGTISCQLSGKATLADLTIRFSLEGLRELKSHLRKLSSVSRNLYDNDAGQYISYKNPYC